MFMLHTTKLNFYDLQNEESENENEKKKKKCRMK